MMPFKFASILLLLVSVLVVSSCNNDDDNPFAGLACYDFPPNYGQLEVRTTINNENRSVPIEIFIGNYDENRRVYRYDTLTTNRGFYEVPNGRVGIAATYKHGNKRIVAIESLMFEPIDNDDDYDDFCTNCCFEPGYRVARLELKNRD